jgi:hypothetical protein
MQVQAALVGAVKSKDLELLFRGNSSAQLGTQLHRHMGRDNGLNNDYRRTTFRPGSVTVSRPDHCQQHSRGPVLERAESLPWFGNATVTTAPPVIATRLQLPSHAT